MFSFFRNIFFSSLIPFSLFTPSKRTQNLFTTARQISSVLFILITISVVIYTFIFRITCLYHVYTYLHLLLRLRVTEKALQLPSFSSLCFFLFSKSGRTDESCSSTFDMCWARRVWLNSETLEDITWQIVIPTWNFVCENMICHVLSRK